MNIFLDFFWESFLYIFRHFLKVKVHNWKMFFGMPDIPYTYKYILGGGGVKSRCWVQAYVFRKIESIPNGVRHSYRLSD